jgi:4-alpha-glucanotransferase
VPDAWSVDDGYFDVRGGWHETPAATRQAIHAVMGAEGEAPPAPPPMWFVAPGEQLSLKGPADLVLEDGTTLTIEDALPPDLPLGYHDLRPLDGGLTTRVVVTPRRCPLPSRSWGWAAQLYALRSAASWGTGDLADLEELCRWTADLGGRVTMVSPFHAPAPWVPMQPSPYFASSRIWRNPLLLRVAALPGADEVSELAELDSRGRALNTTERIDRDQSWLLKRHACELVFERVRRRAEHQRAFDEWRAAQDPSLRGFATWCALAERFGPGWQGWAHEYRHPASPAVAAFAEAEIARVELHEWIQWQVDQQLRRAGDVGVGLIADIAVGFDIGGADGWLFQDLLGLGCRVGAPPDIFAPDGQDWGLPPFVPWRLRAARYEPFIATIRSAFTGCGGIRIDHVMGLFRLYWIPPDGDATVGAYVRYPAIDLLDLLTLEATRAGAFVVGEDLGTVEDDVRIELATRAVLSYRLLWFEDRPPHDLPRQALAAVSTHDLPTTAGAWTGSDFGVRTRLGLASEGDVDPFHEKVSELTGLAADAPVEDAIVALHAALAQAPSLVLLAGLEDAAAVEERPNVPGTIDEWPNWRIPLPMTLEQLEGAPLAHRIAATLDEGVRG